MGWIAGWNKRIKLTISGSCIEEDLSDFPIMVHLDSTCSGVFNELGSNSKRISVVTSTQQQCYVEIENWDESTKNAWLWVKIPTLSSGVSSDLYLYYDNLRPDNSVYVGTVGETSAQNVWDSNFVSVWHMSQDPTGGSGCIKDSTVNTNHGTPAGSMTTEDLVDGKIWKALDFDGSNDQITASPFVLNSGFTLEMVSSNATAGRQMGENNGFQFWSHDGSGVAGYIRTTSGDEYYGGDSTVTGWKHIVATNVGGTKDINTYTDGDLLDIDTLTGSVNMNSAASFCIGDRWASSGFYSDADIDEVRISNIARSAPWIKATYYSNWDSLLNYGDEEIVSLGFLPGWNNRLKLTIQNDYVDNTLTDFPVMIKLSNSSGFNSYDNRDVFYELEVDINRKKIAITDSTGILQCFVEIERFSCAETEAVLWTKLPVVYASVGTHFYLYYDKTQADNVEFVGDVNSIVAQNVWDSNFVGVWHMNQDPTGGSDCIKDSTLKVNHGTPGGAMASGDLVDGKIGKALDFDGNDDCINLTGLVVGNSHTISFLIKAAVNAANSYIFDAVTGRVLIGTHTSQNTLSYHDGSSWHDTSLVVLNGVWHHVTVITKSSGNLQVYVDNVGASDTIVANSIGGSIGLGSKNDHTSDFIKGMIDEPRISNVERSAPWIKATYHSNWDSLIVFEKEDISASWLDDWAHRIKLTIDHTKVDSSLINFPVLVTLTSGVQSDFFDEMYLSEGITWYDHQLVINKNSEGTYDTTHAYTPSVIKDGDTYKIWYSGSDGTNIRILYATSTNGTIWANHQMVINIGAEGTYDTSNAYSSTVIKDGDTYKIWYSGSDGTNYRILYATSTNGTTWSGHQMVIDKDVEETYDTIHVYFPSVIKDGDIYKIWYSGYDGTNLRTIYATSTNGTTWANHQMVVDIGSEGTYDTARAYASTVIKDGDTYKIWYTGSDGSNYRTLYATSTNGTIWANHQLVIDKDVEETYDTTHACFPSVIKDGDTYKIWYSGSDGTNYRILYAKSNDSDLNRKKIVLADNNGTTQCPVEIEQWDFYNGKVNLWTKIPTIVFDVDTDIYLYYDSSKDDNDSYVGDVGSVPARSVWDSNFVGVWHLCQDPSGGSGCIKDSTSNNLNGTPGSALIASRLKDGKIGKAIEFDDTTTPSTNDYINIGDKSNFDDLSAITVEIIHKHYTLPSNGATWAHLHSLLDKFWDGTDRSFEFYISYANDKICFVVPTDTLNDGTEAASSNSAISINTNYYTAGRWDSSTSKNSMFVNGVKQSTEGTKTGNTVRNNTSPMWIGASYYNNDKQGPMDGPLDEARISNTARSSSWIKATYYSNWNTFLTYDSAQNYNPPPDYYYHGYVKEKGAYVARKLYLYRRDTGVLVDNCMSSSGTGYYLLETLVSGEHFILALDDDAGDSYNALVQDRLYPNGM